MDKSRNATRIRFISLATFMVWGLPIGVQASTWYATNDGVDSPMCGHTRDHACRSISQAVDNATDGDVIWVGAGRYGDLNGNGSFADPGDEHPFDSGNGTSCVVCITKAV